MTAKAQGLGTTMDSLMARLDRAAADASKTVDDAVARFEATSKAHTTAIAGKIDAATAAFEDKMNQISNGGPPLDDSTTVSPAPAAKLPPAPQLPPAVEPGQA